MLPPQAAKFESRPIQPDPILKFYNGKTLLCVSKFLVFQKMSLKNVKYKKNSVHKMCIQKSLLCLIFCNNKLRIKNHIKQSINND